LHSPRRKTQVTQACECGFVEERFSHIGWRREPRANARGSPPSP
jgi:hypothetical protein